MFTFKKRTKQVSDDVMTVTPGYEGLFLYYRQSCPFCRYVSAYLKSKGIVIDGKNIIENQKDLNELISRGGKRQVPCLKIVIGCSEKWLYESTDIVEFIEQFKPV